VQVKSFIKMKSVQFADAGIEEKQTERN